MIAGLVFVIVSLYENVRALQRDCDCQSGDASKRGAAPESKHSHKSQTLKADEWMTVLRRLLSAQALCETAPPAGNYAATLISRSIPVISRSCSGRGGFSDKS